MAPGDPSGALARREIAPGTPFFAGESAVFDPLPKLARCGTPALILHGAEDAVSPIAKARGIFSALATADKELVLRPARGHNALSWEPPHWQAIARFVGGRKVASA